jgi:hypothetical protein
MALTVEDARANPKKPLQNGEKHETPKIAGKPFAGSETGGFPKPGAENPHSTGETP